MSARISIAISIAFLALLPLLGCPPIRPGDRTPEISEPNRENGLEPDGAQAVEPNAPSPNDPQAPEPNVPNTPEPNAPDLEPSEPNVPNAAEPNEPTFSGPRYVDDDGPHDPGPGDPNISDPNEDGSEDHPFDAIQEALSAAPGGQTIIVLDGTYTGVGNRDLDFHGKSLTLRSANGPENCVIDCEEQGRGFTFHRDETETSILVGFTITRGSDGPGAAIHCYSSSPTITRCVLKRNWSWNESGGGLYCYSSSPTISACTFRENYCVVGDGGGVCCEASSPFISNCTFEANEADIGCGGGLYCRGGSTTLARCTLSRNVAFESHWGGGGVSADDAHLTLIECTISNNHSSDSLYAGGISCRNCVLTLTRCTISGNGASELFHFIPAFGGGVYCSESIATIANCTIRANRVFGSGAGAYLTGGATRFVNCTISENSVDDEIGASGGGVHCTRGTTHFTNCTIGKNYAGTYGGGVFCERGTTSLVNCTVYDNAASVSGGGISVGRSTTVLIFNSIFWADTPGEIDGIHSVTYSDVQGGYAGTGNIAVDPLFRDPSLDDCHLSPGSPCIDAGNTAAVPADLADLDSDGDVDERTPLDLGGSPRFVDDPATPDTGIPDPPAYRNVVDIGAHEFVGP